MRQVERKLLSQPLLQNPEQAPRRSARTRRPPQYYGREGMASLADSGEPTTFREAIVSPSKTSWIQAMETEMKSLYDNDVWELVELPEGNKPVGSKWVYKAKKGADLMAL